MLPSSKCPEPWFQLDARQWPGMLTSKPAMDRDWYYNWFGALYQRLYSHRDERQAQVQVELLLSKVAARTDWKILDIGCGAGRHLDEIRQKGFQHAIGLDLSQVLLRETRANGHPVVRGDMRRLPFPDHAFDLLTCFFTSFGYFATSEEDIEVLGGFSALLKPGGYLYLDLINKHHLIRHLIAEDEKHVDGIRIRQARRIENDMVYKEIDILHADGRRETHRERVRLYTAEEIVAMGDCCSLSLSELLGTEGGEVYHAENSPRMCLLLKKTT